MVHQNGAGPAPCVDRGEAGIGGAWQHPLSSRPRTAIQAVRREPIGPTARGPFAESDESQTCFMCRRHYLRGDGRFCSALCRAGFDAGLSPHDPVRPRFNQAIQGDGFAIECAGCRKVFTSRGLRCCSKDCERNYRQRAEIAAGPAKVEIKPVQITVSTLAEAGIETVQITATLAAGIEPGANRRECEECGSTIPRFRGSGKARREVRKDARFCSSKCREKARKAPKYRKPVLTAIEVKKFLQNGGPR